MFKDIVNWACEVASAIDDQQYSNEKDETEREKMNEKGHRSSTSVVVSCCVCEYCWSAAAHKFCMDLDLAFFFNQLSYLTNYNMD